ncbi:MAG: RAG2 PHD domain containing protein [Methylocystaceae bacterium]|nr:MAG: RAG2 PHD domain containing protein [Methylocystaceae bacterium]
MRSSTNIDLESQFPRKATDLRFVVGQDEDGHWIVIEDRRRGGGIFVSRQAALQFVASETGQPLDSVPCARERLRFWS